MNLEWRNPNTEVPNPVERTEPVEVAQNVEQELSPEQIEQIMAKVQDIDAKGTAFTVVRSSKNGDFNALKQVMEDGVLGSSLKKWGVDSESTGNKEESVESSKAEWLRNIKNNRKAAFYFNVVGRAYGLYNDDKYVSAIREELKPEINRHQYFNRNGGWGIEKYAIIFNTTHFKEVHPFVHRNDEKNRPAPKTKTYRANMIYEGLSDEERKIYKTWGAASVGKERVDIPQEIIDSKRIKPNTSHGFMGHFRLAPRLFNGMIIRIDPQLTNEESEVLTEFIREKSQGLTKFAEDSTGLHRLQPMFKVLGNKIDGYPDNIQRDFYRFRDKYEQELIEKRGLKKKTIQDVVGLMTKTKIPVYDERGNLLWPKQMSYEEVKIFVAERDAKNTNKEEK